MARLAATALRLAIHGLVLSALAVPALAASPAAKQNQAAKQKWVASWAASAQGPYPAGNSAAQPELSFAFPIAAAGASDQSFRLMVKPDLWGKTVRLRFANTFGTVPLRLDGVFVGLQAIAGNLAPGTNRPVSFNNGSAGIVVPPGQSAFSDPVALAFVKDPQAAMLEGRRLAVSFHVAGSSGPMTWHAAALTTSYLTAPGVGAHGADLGEDAYPYTTTSWYFLDAVEVMAPADTRVVAAFGDSLTDGTGSTVNGDDRWSDVLSRRLHALYGTHIAVVNAGIAGNQVMGPAGYAPEKSFAGGPSALQRLERDVFGLSGLSAIVWLEGINDFGAAGTSADAVVRGMEGFDGVADFDAATADGATGALLAEFQPSSTLGGTGDLLHPNRAGYQAMGYAVDLGLFEPSAIVARNRTRLRPLVGDILAER